MQQSQFGACSSGIDSSSLPFSHYNCKCCHHNAQLGELSRKEGAGEEAGKRHEKGQEKEQAKGQERKQKHEQQKK